jgi:hypothetical protein
MTEVWFNLGVLYEKCKQPDEALIAYSKVLELDSDDSEAQRRIMLIKSPYYQVELQNNSSTLSMKFPKFTLPNSLMILKKYKKAQTASAPGASQGNNGNQPG